MAIKDEASAKDHVEAGVSRDAVAPNAPCQKCGAETKEDHEPGWRVCSKRDCRHKFNANATLN